ncbi:SCO7613 C-terminal domain-containing membrane protein [Promicromonospora sp. CA-289599]|uniref:SCO7613 C-terminal domain-containing membrane protein n=1 Tax=Promicromonospora sp. CA-289599 TaxID=3240014 RepID=UPI003D8A3D4F
MPPNWAGDVVARLTDTTRCPACGEHLASVVCAACGLNVSGREAQEVWRLSVAAADSLRDREAALDAMRRAQGTMTSGAVGSGTRAVDGAARPAPAAGTVPRPAPAPAPSVSTGPSAFAPPSPVPPPPRAPAPAQPPARPVRSAPPVPSAPSVRQAEVAPPAPRPSGPGISLQPILAGAGAALLAVSAVVFVFFTFGDNLLLRAVVTGIVTATAVTVGALLRRAGLRTTSEAVAALAVVLAWVDVELGMQAGLLGQVDPALARAAVLAVLAPGFVALGAWLRVRSWVSAGLVSAPVVPVLVAAGLPFSPWSMWWWALALLLVGVVAWAAMRVAPQAGERSGTRLVAETWVLRVVRAAGPPLALLAALGAQVVTPDAPTGTTAILWSGVVLFAVVLGAWLRVRSWASVGLVSAPLVPVLVLLAFPGPEASVWWWVLAFVLVAVLAWAAMRQLRKFRRRLGGAVTFELEEGVLRILRGAGLPLALLASGGAEALPPLTGSGATAVLWSAVVVLSAVLGYWLRVRSWTTTALVTAPFVPVLIALGVPASVWSTWWWVLALVLAGLVGWAAGRALPTLSERHGTAFPIETTTLRVMRAAAFPLALAASFAVEALPSLTRLGGTAVLWSGVVLLAVVLGYRLRVRSWLSTAILAAPVVPVLVALSLPGSVWSVWSAWWWVLALVLVAVVAWAAIRLLPALARRLDAPGGSLFVAEARVLRVVRATGLPAALVVSLLAALTVPVAPLTGLETTTALWSAVVLTGAVLGHALRVRAWTSVGVLAAPVVSLLLLGAVDPADGSWLPAVAFLAAALTTLLGRAARRVSGPRLGSPLRAEIAVLDVVALVAVPFAVLLSFAVDQPEALPGLGGTALLVALTAVTVVIMRRVTHHRHWTVFGGALAVAAGGLLGWVGQWSGAGWVPFGAACVWTALALLTAPRLLRAVGLGSVRGALAPATRDDLLLSGWIGTAAAAVPAVGLVLVRVTDAWVAAWSVRGTSWSLPTGALIPPAPANLTGRGVETLVSLNLPSAHLGTVALAVVTLLAARLARRGRRFEAVVAPVAVLLAAFGLALDPRLAIAFSLAAVAVLAFALVAATADRSVAWRTLRPAVVTVQGAVRALVRASGRLRSIGGTGVTGADLRPARATALTGAFVATGMLLAFSWASRPTAAVGALVVCALLLSLRAVLRPTTHPWLVGAGYAYPLAVLGVVLSWLDLSTVAAICTVSAIASLVTIAVTLGGRTSRNEWYVVLGVTAGPFAAGVVTVVLERTWWSAGAAAAMLALELVLLLTARAGLAHVLRAGAAFLLLPTASVMVTSAGAMILEVSGSPYVLPAVALFVSAVAGGAARIAERIATRVPDGGPLLAAAVRRSLERSVLLTGAITIFLAYARPAAGPDVAVAVLLLLMAGAVLVAREPGRRHVWPLAGALGLAALWTALAGGEVRLVEAYTLPPALGAVVVGALVAWRTGRSEPGTAPVTAATHAWRLAAVGAGLAVVPSLIVHLTRTEPADWRPFALVGGAVIALATAYALDLRPVRERLAFLRDSWTRPVRRGLVAVGGLAALSGAVESLHVAGEPVYWIGSAGGPLPGLPPLTWYDGSPFGTPVGAGWVFAAGLGWALLSGALLVAAAVLARRSAHGRTTSWLDRWGMAPGLVLGTLGAVVNTRPVWGSIVSLLVVELGLLAVLVLVTRRAGRPGVGAPPWLVWLCAAAVAIAAWAPRELRVEAFSVMLGAGLIWSGATALRHWVAAGEPKDVSAGLMTWPLGFGGSWRTIGLGIAALVGPSVLSTATDPLTIRASWVVLAALASVLVGSRLRLSAPFWLGVWTLAVEVVIVFAKLGVGVSPLPWILTLVPAAVVLLIIATLDERRTAASGGTAAYLRDLR